MKKTYYIIAALICLDAATILLASIGITGIPLTPWSSDQFADQYNATAIVEAWDPSTQSFYDVGSGLRFLWNMNLPLIESFTAMLQALGSPLIIVDVLKAIFRFTLVGFAISFLSGRDFMP